MATTSSSLHRTPLYDLHVELGARIVPFAGYEMPVQYPSGIMAEHNWTRQHAGLFDVSHMGQAFLAGPDHETTARAIEALVPGDVLGLASGHIRYSQLTNPNGGIIDDLMITRSQSPEDDGTLGLVVNASRKDVDYAWLREHLPKSITLITADDRALLALQGPAAVSIMERHCPKAVALRFMTATSAEFDGMDCRVARSGYTGEDGFEISIKAANARALADALLAEAGVKPIGLGARDSLRLEAGLCLYGHDIDETTSPVEAGLVWSIGKRRRSEGGFTGDLRVLKELANGPSRRRVGIKPDGRAPAREGTRINDATGSDIGVVTSGGFGPTANGPVAMGYVAAASAKNDTPLNLIVRDKPMPARVAALPFVPHTYKR
ncbi:glycine cleavage system aminomethyltransferase GcvT [soil metagenome]